LERVAFARWVKVSHIVFFKYQISWKTYTIKGQNDAAFWAWRKAEHAKKRAINMVVASEKQWKLVSNIDAKFNRIQYETARKAMFTYQAKLKGCVESANRYKREMELAAKQRKEAHDKKIANISKIYKARDLQWKLDGERDAVFIAEIERVKKAQLEKQASTEAGRVALLEKADEEAKRRANEIAAEALAARKLSEDEARIAREKEEKLFAELNARKAKLSVEQKALLKYDFREWMGWTKTRVVEWEKMTKYEIIRYIAFEKSRGVHVENPY